MIKSRDEGLIGGIGLSSVVADHLRIALDRTEIVCVQNAYNLVERTSQPVLDACIEHDIAFVPFFPLGGFSPVQSTALSAVASRLGAAPMSVALAWLLQRSPNILLIPGTSSVAHLRENIAGAGLDLSGDDLAELDKIGL